MKRIFKYPTGAEVPKGAIYLYTWVEVRGKDIVHEGKVIPAVKLVWHYFLVEVKE